MGDYPETSAGRVDVGVAAQSLALLPEQRPNATPRSSRPMNFIPRLRTDSGANDVASLSAHEVHIVLLQDFKAKVDQPNATLCQCHWRGSNDPQL